MKRRKLLGVTCFPLYRHILRAVGFNVSAVCDADEKQQTPTATPTSTPDPRTPFEIKVYYDSRREAAVVTRDYVEYAVSDVWPTDVSIETQVPEHARGEDFYDWINGYENRARDCDVYVNPTEGTYATERTAVSSASESLKELYGKPLQETGYGWEHKAVNGVLHEVAHVFGAGHCDGGHKGGCMSPMNDYCMSVDCQYHKYTGDVPQIIEDTAKSRNYD